MPEEVTTKIFAETRAQELYIKLKSLREEICQYYQDEECPPGTLKEWGIVSTQLLKELAQAHMEEPKE